MQEFPILSFSLNLLYIWNPWRVTKMCVSIKFYLKQKKEQSACMRDRSPIATGGLREVEKL